MMTVAFTGCQSPPAPGIPCQEIVDDAGPISSLTYQRDLVSGWAFDIKQPTGFAKHGCQVVSSEDGHPVRSGRYSLRFEVRDEARALESLSNVVISASL